MHLQPAVDDRRLEHSSQAMVLAVVVSLCADSVEGWRGRLTVAKIVRARMAQISTAEIVVEDAGEYVMPDLVGLHTRELITLDRIHVTLTGKGIDLVEPLLPKNARFTHPPQRVDEHALTRALANNAAPYEELALGHLIYSCVGDEDGKAAWRSYRLAELIPRLKSGADMGVAYTRLAARGLVRITIEDDGYVVHPTPALAELLFGKATEDSPG